MQKRLLLILPLLLAATGCTAFSLERHTVNQSMSATDYRYRAALRCLAVVADNPGTLPSYAQLSNGTTSITDTGVFNSVTTLTGNSLRFASELLAFTGSRTPVLQWTVSPAADFTQLEAMRCACNWVLGGAECDCQHILADPQVDTSPGSHFGVDGRLARLPEGWLHVGRRSDAPPAAMYKEHCGDTWVWVMSDGIQGLSGFTLVLQDIATLDVEPTDGAVPANLTPPILVTLWVVQGVIPPKKSDSTQGAFNEHGGISTAGEVCSAGTFKTSDDASTASAAVKPRVVAAVYDDTDGPEEIPDPGLDCLPHCPRKEGSDSADASDAYSPTLVFRVDRVVRPECKCQIESRLRKRMDAAKNGATSVPTVNICWEEWMAWTAPYQGQRTGVTPGAPTSKAPLAPPGHLPPSQRAIGEYYATFAAPPPIPPTIQGNSASSPPPSEQNNSTPPPVPPSNGR